MSATRSKPSANPKHVTLVQAILHHTPARYLQKVKGCIEGDFNLSFDDINRKHMELEALLVLTVTKKEACSLVNLLSKEGVIKDVQEFFDRNKLDIVAKKKIYSPSTVQRIFIHTPLRILEFIDGKKEPVVIYNRLPKRPHPYRRNMDTPQAQYPPPVQRPIALHAQEGEPVVLTL